MKYSLFLTDTRNLTSLSAFKCKTTSKITDEFKFCHTDITVFEDLIHIIMR